MNRPKHIGALFISGLHLGLWFVVWNHLLLSVPSVAALSAFYRPVVVFVVLAFQLFGKSFSLLRNFVLAGVFAHLLIEKRSDSLPFLQPGNEFTVGFEMPIALAFVLDMDWWFLAVAYVFFSYVVYRVIQTFYHSFEGRLTYQQFQQDQAIYEQAAKQHSDSIANLLVQGIQEQRKISNHRGSVTLAVDAMSQKGMASNRYITLLLKHLAKEEKRVVRKFRNPDDRAKAEALFQQWSNQIIAMALNEESVLNITKDFPTFEFNEPERR